jgi:hypothetical protein
MACPWVHENPAYKPIFKIVFRLQIVEVKHSSAADKIVGISVVSDI